MKLAQKVLTVLNNRGGVDPEAAHVATVLGYSPTVYYKMDEAALTTTVVNYGSLASANITHNNTTIAAADTGPFGAAAAKYVIANSDATRLHTAALSAVYDQDNTSWSLWFKHNGDWATFSSAEVVIRVYGTGGNNTFHAYKSAANRLLMNARSNATTYTNNIDVAAAGFNDNNWHHLLATMDVTGTNFQVWVDGSSVGTASYGAGSWTALVADETCLASNTFASPTFEGAFSLAHVAWIESVLDGTDAAALYGAGPV